MRTTGPGARIRVPVAGAQRAVGGDGGDGGENALGGSLGLMYGAPAVGGFAAGGDDGVGGESEDGGHNTLYGSPIIQDGE